MTEHDLYAPKHVILAHTWSENHVSHYHQKCYKAAHLRIRGIFRVDYVPANVKCMNCGERIEIMDAQNTMSHEVSYEHQILFEDLSESDRLKKCIQDIVAEPQNITIDQSVDGHMLWRARFFTAERLTPESIKQFTNLLVKQLRLNIQIFKLNEYFVIDQSHKIEVWRVDGDEVFIPMFLLNGKAWHHYSAGKGKTGFYSTHSSQAAWNRIARNFKMARYHKRG